ncbi:MAG: Zn-dependent hydrolase [Alphaproteobacteria bacterium]
MAPVGSTELKSLRVDGDRLWASLMTMAEIGGTAGGGSNRLTLTDLDRDARDLLAKWCLNVGADMRVDAMGNMIARRGGTEVDLPAVMVGSHLDTQPMGGRFDGVLGVLAALEILRALDDAGLATPRSVELVNWTNEEGARFAPAMIGSGVYAGIQELAAALNSPDSKELRFGDELNRIGYAGAEPVPGRAPFAYFELHIEQGPLLEAEGVSIGVVTHAQGVRWLDVVVDGVASHAGTTPMGQRHDALVGAARAIEAIAKVAADFGPGAVATVGQLQVDPGSRNVIPGRVRFSVDARHPDSSRLASLVDAIKNAVRSACAEAKLKIGIADILSFAPTSFDESCLAAVSAGADNCGYGHRNIVSGGGHDACNIARIAPAAMVFCPCVDGISHAEAEDIRPEWAEAGANVLLQAVLAKATDDGRTAP